MGTTILTMGRTPDGPSARQTPITLRLTKAERATLDRQRALRGYSDRSAYIRSLIQADSHRLGMDESKGNMLHARP